MKPAGVELTEFHILTVCTGNVHRSAFGAEMLRTWASWYLPARLARDVIVRSSGTRAAVGSPMDARLLTLLKTLGGDGQSHRASLLGELDITAADLVLTATRQHRDAVLSLVPSALRRTFTIREAGRVSALLTPHPEPPCDSLENFAGALAHRRHQAASVLSADDDIVDPEGRGDDAFMMMVREELPSLIAIAVAAFGMPRPDAQAYLSWVSSDQLGSSVG